MTIFDDSPQCGREAFTFYPDGVVVRCSLPKGHRGRHTFVFTWTDPRDASPGAGSTGSTPGSTDD